MKNFSPFREKGQGQPKVIIFSNFIGPMSQMLHTRPQGIDFGEDFQRVFTRYQCGGHLGHVTKMQRTNFPSLGIWRRHMKFGFDWPSGF